MEVCVLGVGRQRVHTCAGSINRQRPYVMALVVKILSEIELVYQQ